MADLLLPAGVIAASLAVTYFFCIRPMRKGHCARQGLLNSADTELDLNLRKARADLEKIRSEVPDNEAIPSGRPSDPSEPRAHRPPGRTTVPPGR